MFNFCFLLLADCPDINEEGTKVSTANVTYMTQVNVTCSEGFETSDVTPQLMTCEAGGVWSTSAPVCEGIELHFQKQIFSKDFRLFVSAVECPLLTVSHSNATQAFSTFTQPATIVCDEGYIVPNTSSRVIVVTCLSNRTFDLVFDSCLRKHPTFCLLFTFYFGYFFCSCKMQRNLLERKCYTGSSRVWSDCAAAMWCRLPIDRQLSNVTKSYL